MCEGVHIEDGVFVGHGVMFVNDKFPKATNALGELAGEEDWELLPVVVGPCTRNSARSGFSPYSE